MKVGLQGLQGRLKTLFGISNMRIPTVSASGTNMRIPTVSASGTYMRIPTRGLTGAYSGGRPNYVLNLHPRLGIRTDILVTRPFKNYITSVDQV